MHHQHYHHHHGRHTTPPHQPTRSTATLDPPDPSELLLGVPWLHGADDAEIDDVRAITELKSYGQSDVIGRAGDPSDGIYLVVSGMVRMTLLSSVEYLHIVTVATLHSSQRHGCVRHGTHDSSIFR
jgi:hypothetical protein